MREPDVTLTDFALAAICAVFVVLLAGDGVLQALFAGLYAALGLAALLGALAHGWFWDRNRGIGKANWLVTMLAIGGANLFLWLIAARVFDWPAWLGNAIAFGQAALYAGLAIFVTRSFILSSGFSLPPTLALLAGFLWVGNPLGAAGLAVALAGAVQQAAGWRGLGLTHNALYHLFEAVAFVLVFLSIPGLVETLAAR